jgi:hypothetical protein
MDFALLLAGRCVADSFITHFTQYSFGARHNDKNDTTNSN